ncbi:MAG TPA: LLM class F420-dependent oxidoreductase [Thermomicrobiales bacterium]|nr:LLM class F420-dependent oxidoreductase [Thermomicrobiales bacterium]
MTVSPPSARPITIALQVGQQHSSYAENRRAWLEAEALGVDVLYNWDHLRPPTGDPTGRHLEGYTLLAAMAEVTTRPRIGCLVTCDAFRNPDLLADMARTIDHISGGRFILGIGAGWNDEEFRDYGYTFGPSRQRLADLEASLGRIEARMARLNPPPVQAKLPILIGGSGERVMLGIVARHADIWHLFADAETARHKVEVLERRCEDVGRDPATIERAIDLRPEVHADLDAFVALGFTQFTVAQTWPGFDLGYLREVLQWRDALGANAEGIGTA